jgi:hypothetical protein
MSFKLLSYDGYNNIFEFLKNNELKNVIVIAKKYYKISKENMRDRKINKLLSLKNHYKASEKIAQVHITDNLINYAS